MTTLLLEISIILLIYLSFYALIFLILSLGAFFMRRPKAAGEEKTNLEISTAVSEDSARLSDNPVGIIPALSVLIPAYNEGAGLVDAVSAVSGQDYAGWVEINILVKDEADTSIPELLKFYKRAGQSVEQGSNQNRLVLFRSESRRINLIKTGRQTKKDKLSFILPEITTPFVAFLDADHRPTKNWLSSSIALFSADNIAAVQTRRRPLIIHHLAQIWDSTQNHFGNELLNNFLSRSGRSVFFTGTAAVFRTAVLHRFNLSDSITEDTYLSYDVLTAGFKIVYNSAAVSFEEVAPSFTAYVFRRRRWSAGHNQNFFRHLWSIISAKISWRDKLILWFHGQFYLVPLAVWLLLSVYGVYFYGQLGGNFRLAASLSALFFGGLLAYGFRQPGRRFLGDWFVAALWLWPQFAVWAVYAYKFMGMENYYYILIFPYQNDWIPWQIILLIAPLTVVFAALYYFKGSRQWRNFWVVPTYIFTMFLDIYASLLGFWDFLWGRAYWSKISRQNAYSMELLPPELKAKLVTGRPVPRLRRRWSVLAGLSLIFFIILNDLLAVNNCGEVKYFLWPPLIFKTQSAWRWQLQLTTALAAPASVASGASSEDPSSAGLKVSAVSSIQGGVGHFNLSYYIDGKLIGTKSAANGTTSLFVLDYPLGWTKHAVTVQLHGQGGDWLTSCTRTANFATTLKELRGNDLYINNEKFLIKGIIPSFSSGQMNLSMIDGLKQFKAIGVNVVRFYHSVNDQLLQEAAANNLLVIDQPDASTWGELSLTNSFQIWQYLGLYRRLVAKHQGEPYILWDGLGNEWELGKQTNQSDLINLTDKIILAALKAVPNWPTSYSTYYSFIKYPVDISGINMLDTGPTYWQEAVALLKSANKPFYASEFGGFVAFWERTDPEVRINRLISEWPILLKAGALGANFYESHDNWAQSVAIGYNDPFKPDQPDDVRGFWDASNQPKPELRTLAALLSDFRVTPADSLITTPAAPVRLVIKNIRDYNLKNVVLSWTAGSQVGILKNLSAGQPLGDFRPGETKIMTVNFGSALGADGALTLAFAYTSHAGLSETSQLDLILPVEGPEPLVLNNDFVLKSRDADSISGRMISSDYLSAVLPADWHNFSFNGQNYVKVSPRFDLSLSNPYHPVDDWEFSQDGQNWQTVPLSFQPGSGWYYFRFRWPELKADKESLILSGLGASQVTFFVNNQNLVLSAQNYREDVISAAQLGNPAVGDLITFMVYRDQIFYINKVSAARDIHVDLVLDQDTSVKFAAPQIFAPLNIIIKKQP